MAAADVVVLVAAVVTCLAAAAVLGAAGVLVAQVRRLDRGLEILRGETLPLVHQAREVAGMAASEMARVEAVLADTETVTAAVDSATRFAQRALATPIVKALALRAGTSNGLRRLKEPSC